LRDDDTGMKPGKKEAEIKGDWNGKLTRFISRLEAKAEDRRYGFMFQPPEATLGYDWLGTQAVQLLAPGEDKHGIKVVDFSEVPTATSTRLVLHLRDGTKCEIGLSALEMGKFVAWLNEKNPSVRWGEYDKIRVS